MSSIDYILFQKKLFGFREQSHERTTSVNTLSIHIFGIQKYKSEFYLKKKKFLCGSREQSH